MVTVLYVGYTKKSVVPNNPINHKIYRECLKVPLSEYVKLQWSNHSYQTIKQPPSAWVRLEDQRALAHVVLIGIVAGVQSRCQTSLVVI